MGLDIADDFEQAAEEKLATEISDNAIEDIVEVGRGNIIGNEEVFVLTSLQYGTAWLADMQMYLNSCLQGPPGSGKTQLQSAAEELVPSLAIYGNGEITDFSNNAALDDPDWDRSLIFIGDEYDKISGEIQEYFKSMAGEDGGYAKKRNVEDSDATGGYSPDVVSSSAIPFQFLYAPTGRKQGIGEELGSRMMKLPVEDTRKLRRGIFYSHFDYDEIDWVREEAEYIFDTHHLEAGLRAHLRELPIEETYEFEDEDGNTDTETVQTTLADSPVYTGEDVTLYSREGTVRTVFPRWVPVALEPIVDLDSTHTNRVGKMIAGAIRASAVWNHHQRETTTVVEEGEKYDAFVIEAQDVANAVVNQQTLMATTHLLDQRKLDVLEAVRQCNEIGDATVKNIRDWLSQQDKTVPSDSKLRGMLEELAEEFYVSIDEGAGPNNAHLYSLHRESPLNVPRTKNLDQYAASDGIDIDGPHCNVDLSDPFAECSDPIRNQPFEQTVREFEEAMSSADEFTPSEDTGSDEVTTLSGAMGSDDNDASSAGTNTATSSDDDEMDLASFGDDGEESVLDDDPVVQVVYEHLHEHNGTDGRPYNLEGHDHPIEDPHFLGVADTDVAIEDADLTETIYDPSNDVWDAVAEGRGDTWEQCSEEIDTALEMLRDEELLTFEEPSPNNSLPEGNVAVVVEEESQ